MADEKVVVEDKATKKKLKNLQSKWINAMSDDDPKNDSVLTESFDLDGSAEGTDTLPEEVAPEPEKKKKIKKGEAPPVDLELLNDMIQKAVNTEVERAIRELKEEIRSQSETTRKDLFNDLKLEIDTVRQEIEFNRGAKRQKGIFDRF